MTLAAPMPTDAETGGGKAAQGGRNKAAQRLFGLVREIRAEIQNIGRSLDAVDTALALAAPQSRSAELSMAIAGLNKVLGEDRAGIDARFTALHDLLDASPALSDAASDEVVILENLWRRLIGEITWTAKTTESTVRAGLTAGRGFAREMEWHAGLMTVPARVKQHLTGLRVGNKLRFDATFSDEIRDPQQRREMLEYLRDHPAFADGVVDVDRGLIYRASPNVRRRLVSYIGLPTFGILGGILFVYVITNGVPAIGLSVGDVTGLKPGQFANILSAYLLLVVGQVAHIVVDAVKQQQRGDDSFRAIDDWLLWIHVREMSILVGILALWLTLFGLATAFPTGINGVTAFTAGYSIDSILGLFINRLEAKTTAAATELTTLIKPT